MDEDRYSEKRSPFLNQLAAALHALRGQAGEPTAGEISAEVHIDSSEVADAFECLSCPRWPALRDIVAHLGGDITQFHSYWAAARDEEARPHADPIRRMETVPADLLTTESTQPPIEVREPADDPKLQTLAARPPSNPSRIIPRQLPSDTWRFVGRHSELSALMRNIRVNLERTDSVSIAAIEGPPGVGKTALALHLAHQVKSSFPDGQLYVNLRGFDPAALPMQPEDALRQFLDAFDIPPDRIPVSLEGQAALYRSVMADKQVLVLLDNAESSEQVRSLTPGGGSSLVIVTSRNRLDRLVIYGQAQRITLDALPPDEAKLLIGAFLGDKRVEEEASAVHKIIGVCARLPLALTIVCARAIMYPNSSLDVVANELSEESGILDALRTGESGETDMRAVFSWSYRHLDRKVRRVFRLLAVHPGPDVGLGAVAALLSATESDSRRALLELTRAHLLEEFLPGRWRFHDLLRVYASECAGAEELPDEIAGAIKRAHYWYLSAAYSASVTLMPQRRRLTLNLDEPVHAPRFSFRRTAIDWYEMERQNLLGVVRQSAEMRENRTCYLLSISLAEFFFLRAYWIDWIDVAQLGLSASKLASDRLAEAWCLAGVGTVNWCLQRYEEGILPLRRGSELFHHLEDESGEAYALSMLGNTYLSLDELLEAQSTLEMSLQICRNCGDQWCEGLALISLADLRQRQQRLNESIEYMQASLEVRRNIGDLWGEGFSLQVLGEVYVALGRYDGAIEYLNEALAIRREIGDRGGMASTLHVLGDAFLGTEQISLARMSWEEALEIFDQIGGNEAEQIRRSLAENAWP